VEQRRRKDKNKKGEKPHYTRILAQNVEYFSHLAWVFKKPTDHTGLVQKFACFGAIPVHLNYIFVSF
jgi:hypothetical protein